MKLWRLSKFRYSSITKTTEFIIGISVSYVFKSCFESFISHVARYTGNNSIYMRCNSIVTIQRVILLIGIILLAANIG